MCLTKCFTKLFPQDKMSIYLVLVYKGPTTKWVTVDLIITGIFCGIHLSIKCIV